MATDVIRDDDAFLHWLAGFIDGEGSFFVASAFYPRFCLKLRHDDAPILHEIQRRTGLGRINRSASSCTEFCSWIISRLRDSEALVRILDDHPLRAKKSDDFAIWRIAVGVAGQAPSAARNARLVALRQQLRDVKGLPQSTAERRAALDATDPRLAFATTSSRWEQT